MVGLGDRQVTAVTAFDALMGDLEADRALLNWDVSCQATLAILASTESRAWAGNDAIARVSEAHGPVLHPSFWCDAAAYTSATLIAAVAALGCVALLLPCATATVVTFASIAVPCAALTSLCVGGVFAGFGAAHALVLDLWKP